MSDHFSKQKSSLYEELYNLMKAAFIKMHNLAEEAFAENKYISSHSNFPELKGFSHNGMPNLSHSFILSGPKDYSSLFTSGDDTSKFNLDKDNEFQAMMNFFIDNQGELKKFPFFKDINEHTDLILRIIKVNTLQAFDGYMHDVKDNNFDEVLFKKIGYKLFNTMFLFELPVNICAPILMTRFDEDEISVSDAITIRKLSNNELISCYSIGGYSDTQELFYVSSATHVLEFQGYSVPNGPFYAWSALDHKEAYPIDLIDKWFAAFRIISKHETGYGQVLALPVNWGIRKKNLIEVHGDKIFKFNYNAITNGHWNKPTPIMTAEDLTPTNKLFEFFMNNTSNALNIALKRLNSAYLRESEEDAIIDLVIGIESLVTDNDHGEITYKVSMRTAFILSTLEEFPYTIMETSNLIKKLYDYRSKVVHGSTKLEKSRTIKIRDNIIKDSVTLAMEILEYLIQAIANKPEFLKVANIDSLLLNECVHIPTPIASNDNPL